MLNCYIDQTGGRRSGLPPNLRNLESFQGNGNAWDVLIEAEYTTLECLWDDKLPVLNLRISEFREALLEWKAFIIKTSTTTETSTES